MAASAESPPGGGQASPRTLSAILGRSLKSQGDEHAFSLLYLLAGVFCIYASYSHGDAFCNSSPDEGGRLWGGFLAERRASLTPHKSAAAATGSAEPGAFARSSGLGELKHQDLTPQVRTRRLLWGEAEWVGRREHEIKLQFLAERPPPQAASHGGPAGRAAGNSAVGLAAAATAGGVKSLLLRNGKNESFLALEDGGGTGAGAPAAVLAAGKQGQQSRSLRPEETGPWAGTHGRVVLWLRVEGFTALFLPGLSMVMLGMGLQDSQVLSATLYCVALFQAVCLGVGCLWSFGGFVPTACTDGTVGDPFAFEAMWWVCAVWLGAIVSISTVICCILCCFVGAFVGASNKEKHRHSADEPV